MPRVRYKRKSHLKKNHAFGVFTTVYYRIEGKPNDLQDIYDQYRTLLNKKLLEEGKDKVCILRKYGV